MTALGATSPVSVQPHGRRDLVRVFVVIFALWTAVTSAVALVTGTPSDGWFDLMIVAPIGSCPRHGTRDGLGRRRRRKGSE